MSTVYTYKQIAEHNSPKDTWIIIDDKVYDVSKFLDEHPGGDEIIFDQAGRDATENFVDIGHSDDALKLLKSKCIGTVDTTSEKVVFEAKVEETTESSQGNGQLAVIVAILCFLVGYYFLNDE